VLWLILLSCALCHLVFADQSFPGHVGITPLLETLLISQFF